jgi:hypothetical protein
VKKLLGIVVLGLLLVSCSENSKEEKYFANCVKDAKKFVDYSEQTALDACRYQKQYFLDEFKYYKGKIFSKNNKNALTADEKKKIWDKKKKK